MKLERRMIGADLGGVTVETRADGKGRTLRGYGAVFYNAATPGTQFRLSRTLVERVLPGAFDDALRNDDVLALYNHDAASVLGRTSAGTMTLTIDDTGLRYDIDIPDTATGNEVATLVERGDISGSSFGFRIATPDGEKYHREGEVYVREIRNVQLRDVGPVTFPAYSATSATVRSEDAEPAVQALAAWQAQQESTRSRYLRDARLREIRSIMGH